MALSASRLVRQIAGEQQRRPAVDSVTLNLPFPISVNQLYRRLARSVVKTARYSRWFNDAGWQLLYQHPGRIEGPYTATLEVQNRTKNRPDADNLGKGVFDLLQAHGVISNDNKAEHVEIKWSDEIEGCRVTVRRVANA